MSFPNLVFISPWEFLCILTVLSILLTSGRLPELAAKFGRADIDQIEKLFPRVLVALAVVMLIAFLIR